MSFRTIIIKSVAKLEYSLGYLVVRSDETKRIPIREIRGLIVQNTAVSLTSALLSELVENKVSVVFCDSKANPQFELVPFSNSFQAPSRLKEQLLWERETCDKAWKEIIKQKIINQANNLEKETRETLLQYAESVEVGDSSNREGHAAKVYFNNVFGKDFTRHDDNNVINGYLNYGYSIILSCISRSIVSYGYNSQLGIHHIGETNSFNLSCDLIEPLRPLIDSKVIKKLCNEENFKEVMVQVLSEKVIWDNQNMFLENAIERYVLSVFNALKNDAPEHIKFIEYEL